MYPLRDYVKMKTSGTMGTEKWFLFPRNQLLKTLKETTPQMLLAVCHDGEKITLEYGDRIYINVGSAPFFSGTVMSLGSKKVPFLDVEPNVNLPYEEKVQYFILNHEKIDVAFMMSSTLIHQIMPAIKKPIKLKGFATMDTPEVEIYRGEIEKFTGTIPKSFYASTETQSCSVMSVQHSMCFFFDWRRGLFEFFPVKNGKVEEKPLAMNEVTVGEVYQLVFTNFENEITRFNTKDSFKCVAKGDDLLNIDFPIFRLQGRLDRTISIQNFTRINEEELLTALKETNISFVDFTARLESEEGLGFLALYVEVAENMRPKEIKNALHRQLCVMDKDYKDLAEFFNYIPLKIYTVSQGVFAKYLEGKGGSAPKVDRIDMNEEDLRKITQVVNSKKA
jgi:hypothetical protein